MTHGKARFRDAARHTLASPETGLSHFTDSAAGAGRVRIPRGIHFLLRFLRLSSSTFSRAGGHDGDLNLDWQAPFQASGLCAARQFSLFHRPTGRSPAGPRTAGGDRHPYRANRPAEPGRSHRAGPRAHRAQPGGFVTRAAQAGAWRFAGQQRRAWQVHRAVHARHRVRPRAGDDRRYQDRLGVRRRGGLAGSASGVDRTYRGGTRPAFQPVRLGSHRRGDPDLHPQGPRAGRQAVLLRRLRHS